ncbi:restriction endonuclease subunit S [Litorivicinus sp.]|nr:restriction endonuclease subunit S [Litorivicinus sp.]
MNRYEEYQETGFEWLGKIPSNWGLSRVGKFFTERSEKVDDVTYPPLSVTMSGIVDQLSDVAKTNDGGNRKLVKKHDFVINSRSDRKGSSGISPRDGSVSLINIVLEPRELDPQFIQYLFKNYYFKEEYFRNGKGIHWDLWTTRWDQLKNIKFPIPSNKEQKLISRYLDKKTEQIDSLIEKIQKKIELLKEQRTSLINQCVTKGLDPNVEMKDSGVEWIGEIPSHWGYVKLSRLVESSELGENYSTTNEDTGIPVLKMGNLGRGTIKLEKLEFLEDLSDLDNLLILKKGDFLFNTRNSSDLVGKTCLWCGSLDRVTFNSNILRVHFNHLTTSQYMIFLFNSKSILDLLKITSKGTTNVSAIYFKDLIQISLPIPPLKEQNHIIDFLSPKLSQISKLIEKEDQRISIIREYRQSLISSVVTGKVRVTEDMI